MFKFSAIIDNKCNFSNKESSSVEIFSGEYDFLESNKAILSGLSVQLSSISVESWSLLVVASNFLLDFLIYFDYWLSKYLSIAKYAKWQKNKQKLSKHI